jgi:cell division protein FtsW
MALTQPMQVRGHRGDYVLALAVFVLLAFGLIMMYNINPALSQKLLGRVDSGYYFRGQLQNIAIGIVVWVVAAHIYYQRWRQWAVPLLAVAVIAVTLLLIPGLSTEKNGATRWLDLGPLSFQPAELLKIGLIIYLAAWLERRADDLKSFWDGVVPFVVMLGAASLVIVVLQRDMGTMMALALASVGMFYLAGMRLQHLAIVLSGGLVAGWLLIATFPHRMERFLTFLNPAEHCDDRGYHICQALIGIGSGGLLGLGLGKSIQIHGYLPEAANDSIFAVIGEEFGLIGGILLVGLFGLVIYRGLEITRRAPDTFGMLVAAGITLLIMFQAFINIAAMLSLVPLTGIPLPFISYGGSSMLILMLAVGILFNISRYTVNEGAYADSRNRRWDGRPRVASPSSRRRVRTAR